MIFDCPEEYELFDLHLFNPDPNNPEQCLTCPTPTQDHPDFDGCANCTHPRKLHQIHANCLACIADDTVCYQFQPRED